LIAHSAFCPGETALDIEAVLKQAVLKRGLPVKLVIDNGPAYRAKTLQGICARLGIHLIYCRPYAPEGKGKLERWHRTFRNQFLSELEPSRIRDLSDLNARLWAWLETVYHCAPHSGLEGGSPLERYQQDLPRIRTLGTLAARLDELFHHRVKRQVRKDGTVSYQGERFEVPYELSGRSVRLVVDPHARNVLGVEDENGQSLGAATPLDAVANVQRKR
ncbi:MAG: transposase family protein, partial [bacterium]|nr:transposase family protein [bacterium]